MRKLLTLFILLTPIIFSPVKAQPNCELFKMNGDLKKFEACEKCYEIRGYYQFSREFQEVLDEALEIDSTFAYAYRAKSVAYLKSGDFIQWKYLMDKAVKYDPEGMLGYRGWCRYASFRDYEGAIRDIERLDSLVDHDIGYSVSGEYHLNVGRAICYKSIGEIDKAIQILEKQVQVESHFIGLYDFLHLGVLYLEKKDYEKAISCFEKQEVEYDMAEVAFYRSIALKELEKHQEALEWLKIAHKRYTEGRRMHDGYTHPPDKIYLEDIEAQLSEIQ